MVRWLAVACTVAAAILGTPPDAGKSPSLRVPAAHSHERADQREKTLKSASLLHVRGGNIGSLNVQSHSPLYDWFTEPEKIWICTQALSALANIQANSLPGTIPIADAARDCLYNQAENQAGMKPVLLAGYDANPYMMQDATLFGSVIAAQQAQWFGGLDISSDSGQSAWCSRALPQRPFGLG